MALSSVSRIAATAAASLGFLILSGWAQVPKPEDAPKAKAGPTLTEVEKAILAVDDAFVREYNKGDAKALAALFTEDASALESSGEAFRGRAAIERRYAEVFAGSPGLSIAIETHEIRPISADVVKETGQCLVRPKSGEPVESAYTVLYAKKDGAWRISDVREEDLPPARPGDRLKALEWMVGDWLEEDSDALVRMNCRWSEDRNFLIRSIQVVSRGKAAVVISQRIGWDPAAGQVRSWEFDSSGGFGEGRWSREGSNWRIKHTGTLPDGTSTSATNLFMHDRPDQIRWISTDRVVGDRSVPDLDANILVRVPPPPASAPEPASNVRSPR